MKIIIKPKKITRKNFKKFGDVISTKKIKSININDGYAKRFNDLCRHKYFNQKKEARSCVFFLQKKENFQ